MRVWSVALLVAGAAALTDPGAHPEVGHLFHQHVEEPVDHLSAVSRGQAALDATIRFGHRHLEAAIWEPTAGSGGAAELASAQARQDGTMWGEDPLRTAYAAANLMMTAVLDNLASIRGVLGPQMPVIGPTVLVRSVIEIASRVWWLMEPGIGTRPRVCRELALSLQSARREKQIADEVKALNFPVGPEITEALGSESRVLKRIAGLGISPPTTPSFSPAVEQQRLDAATNVTGEMLKAALSKRVAKSYIYRTYSAVTHGELYGLMSFMESVASAGTPPLLVWQLPPDLLESTIQIAIAAFEAAYLACDEGRNTILTRGWAGA